MTASNEAETEPPAGTELPPRSDGEGSVAPAPRRAPPLLHYAALNIAVWAFLTLQAWLITLLLRSATTVVLLSILLAVGFTAVSVFDYLWLRFGSRGE